MEIQAPSDERNEIAEIEQQAQQDTSALTAVTTRTVNVHGESIISTTFTPHEAKVCYYLKNSVNFDLNFDFFRRLRRKPIGACVLFQRRIYIWEPIIFMCRRTTSKRAVTRTTIIILFFLF